MVRGLSERQGRPPKNTRPSHPTPASSQSPTPSVRRQRCYARPSAVTVASALRASIPAPHDTKELPRVCGGTLGRTRKCGPPRRGRKAVRTSAARQAPLRAPPGHQGCVRAHDRLTLRGWACNHGEAALARAERSKPHAHHPRATTTVLMRAIPTPRRPRLSCQLREDKYDRPKSGSPSHECRA